MSVTTTKAISRLAICFASAGFLTACGGGSQDTNSADAKLLANGEACNPAWVSTTVYREPNAVSYQGINYIANFYSVGKRPDQNSGATKSAGQPWLTGFTCGGTTTTTKPTTTTTQATTTTTKAGTTSTAGTTTTSKASTTSTSAATTTTTKATTTTTAPSTGTINVSTASQLKAAIVSAQPGNVIQMADANYGAIVISGVSGTSSKKITLRGGSGAVLSGSTGLQLTNANYWILDGFTVSNCSNKGIVMDTSSNNILQNLTVHHIALEGVHFRTFSSNNVLQNSNIHDTGTSQPSYGEGVYLGSANSNWGTYTGGKPDTSNNNQVLNNHIGPNVAAEGVDVKEGSSGGLIQGNTFDGTGLQDQNSGDSVIDVKGSGYTISNNTVIGSGAHYNNGFEVHDALKDGVSGAGNTFNNNTFSGLPAADLTAVPPHGFGILVGAKVGKNTYCTNNKIVSGSAQVLGFDAGGVPYPLTTCN